MTTPMLGQQRHPDGKRRFTRTSSKAIAIDLERWIWLFNEAARDLHLEVCTDSLYPADGIAAPSIHVFNRNWTEHRADRVVQKSEMFECVNKGTVLTFQIAVTSGDKRPAPTPEQLKALFSHIGTFHGISQWGNRFGYGRFTVESVSVL